MNFPYGGTGRSPGVARSTTEFVIPRPEAEESSRPILFKKQTLGEIHLSPELGNGEEVRGYPQEQYTPASGNG